jgi:hypothetical protein
MVLTRYFRPPQLTATLNKIKRHPNVYHDLLNSYHAAHATVNASRRVLKKG